MKMLTGQSAVLFLVVFLAGYEAARITEFSQLTAEEQLMQETGAEESNMPDLDWEGCGSKMSVWNRWSCSKTEGCTWKYLYLDTWRQSCRFLDSYKVAHNAVQFMLSELERLEKMSEKFAKTGCLFFTWWTLNRDTIMGKCIRRTHEILRLMRSIGKIKRAAKADPKHPARKFATDPDIATRLMGVAQNLAEGFEKFEKTQGTGLDFSAALRELMSVHMKVREQGAADTHEVNANTSAAMLKLLNVSMTHEQKIKLAGIMREMPSNESEDQGEDMLEAMDGDAHKVGTATAHEVTKLLTPDQTKAMDEDSNETSLVQVFEHKGATNMSMGPLKWVIKHGIGWVVVRLAWLILFAVDVFMEAELRVRFLAVSFVGCLLVRILEFLKNVFWDFGWKGNTDELLAGVIRVGKCPIWSLDMVGFTESHWGPLGPLILDPARFATKWTGVEMTNLCSKRHCGVGATCDGGECFCDRGFYPAYKAAGCEPKVTKHGCACMPTWSTGKSFFKWTVHGCSKLGRCMVDKMHASYESCKSNLPEPSWTPWSLKEGEDYCSFSLWNHEHAKVPAISEESWKTYFSDRAHWMKNNTEVALDWTKRHAEQAKEWTQNHTSHWR